MEQIAAEDGRSPSTIGARLCCRICGSAELETFADLGASPLANSYPTAEELARGELFLPLHARVCAACFLVQLPELAAPEAIFSDYAYFSSFSDSWVEHARRYVEGIAPRLDLGPKSQVVELASNDGYLLQFFREREIPVLGVEPARNVAAAAEEHGIPTVAEFFDAALAERLVGEGRSADLVVANNVLAHMPGVRSFVTGIRTLLKPDGVATLEVPHLLRLMEGVEFDTIYHEHFSYFSLLAAERLFAEQGLAVADVEELPTHGGSLRLHARRAEAGPEPSPAVEALREQEREAGLDRLETYRSFEESVRAAKLALLDFVLRARRDGRTIAAYAAAAKGVTLLNYCGIRSDLIDYVVDRSPHKQGRFLPGTGLPIHPVERVRETRPDLLLLLAWNLRDEIVEQMSWIREWGGRLVVPLPQVEVLE